MAFADEPPLFDHQHPPRQVQEGQETVPLSVAVGVSLKFHPLAPPIGNSGEWGGGICPNRWPRG
jgi:hypothetical protein